MEKITLENMSFYAYHGCFEQEQIVGTKYEITLTLTLDCSKAAQTDNLEDTVSYLEVYGVVKKEMNIKSKLIENVAQRIINAVKNQFPQIVEVEIRLSKLNPPLGGQVNRVTIQMAK